MNSKEQKLVGRFLIEKINSDLKTNFVADFSFKSGLVQTQYILNVHINNFFHMKDFKVLLEHLELIHYFDNIEGGESTCFTNKFNIQILYKKSYMKDLIKSESFLRYKESNKGIEKFDL